MPIRALQGVEGRIVNRDRRWDPFRAAHGRSMDDIAAIAQLSCPGDDRLAAGNWPLAHGLVLDRRAAEEFDRASDTRSHPEVGVRRADYRVCLGTDNIAGL